MAEAIGLVASIATLAGIVRSAIEIVRHGSHIPKDIGEVSNDLAELYIQLDFLHDLQYMTDFVTLSGSKILISLQQSLDRNVTEFESIEKNLRKLAAKSRGTRGQICWLLVGKDEALMQSRRLQKMRSSLNFTINLLILRLNLVRYATSSNTATADSRAQAIPSNLASFGVHSDRNLPAFSCIKSPVSEESSTYDTSRLYWPAKAVSSAVSIVACQIPTLGYARLTFLRGTSTTDRYEIALLLPLLFQRILDARILFSAQNWLSVNIRSSLRIGRLVEETSPFIQACRQGDRLEIRRLLLEGRATVEDRTPENKTPLQIAIHGGSLDAVKALLEHGADANSLFGKQQTSPLSLAVKTHNEGMVRLLLGYGADCIHVTNHGWTPLFYLWWSTNEHFIVVDQAETILRTLAARGDFCHSYTGILDTLGFTAFHMAVMRGTTTQVRLLLNMDPNLVHVKGVLGWTAIHVAASEGRLEMMHLLSEYCLQCDIVTAKDTRGWTLIHLSAAEGHSAITRYLLRLGVDWQSLSTPAEVEVPDRLKGRSCTPLDVASAESHACRLIYLEDVKDVLGGDLLSEQDLEELRFQWADAMPTVA